MQELAEGAPVPRWDHGHSHPHETPHLHRHERDAAPSAGHAAPPTEPSRAVLVNVGEHTGALILSAPAEREGLEVEIHPVLEPSQRTHVWVLPRAGREGTVYAAVFPSLAAGDYAGAVLASNSAKSLCWWSVGAGIGFTILYYMHQLGKF